MKPAVLVIDVINDFVSGVLGSERARSIIPNIRKLLDYAHRSGIPVIYTADSHSPDDRELNLWPRHAIEGTWGAQIVEELDPQPGDYRIAKACYSAFHDTDLDEILKKLGVDTLILAGLVTNICIQHAAADAYFHGYDIVIPEDCVQAASDEEQEAALTYMQRNYAAKITISEELIARET